MIFESKIPKLTKLATFRISDLLEGKTNEEDRKEGLVLGDYLIEIYKNLDV